MADKRPTGFKVDYYYATALTVKSGGRGTRTQMGTSMNQINGAHSETAVLAYLRKRHPGCEITIMELEWQ